MLLQVVIVSTRKGRKGESVAKWFEARARHHGGFDVELVDLAEVNLPLFDEPEHPRFRKYRHEHTKRWSERVARADGTFAPDETQNKAAAAMLDELKRWTTAMQTLRS